MDFTGKTIVLYDGVCGLCNGLVRFLLRFDRGDRFRYAPLQGEFARNLLRNCGLNSADLDSVVLVSQFGLPDEKVFRKSDAILESCRELGGIWRSGTIFRLVPQSFRDRIYDLIARHRYRTFGRYESCPIPKPEHRSKFVDV